MQIGCPNCKTPIALPPVLMRVGVARLNCAHCDFAFVARLGSPSSNEREDRDPDLPIYLEGVKSSSAVQETAGEIGPAQPAFIPADTRTTIVVDADLEREVERHRASRTPADDGSAERSAAPGAAWVAAATDVSPLPPVDTQPVNPQPVDPHRVDTEPAGAPPSDGSATNGRSESAEFECFSEVRNHPPRTQHSTPARLPPLSAAAAPSMAPVGEGDPTLPHDFGAAFPLDPPTTGGATRIAGLIVGVAVFASIILALFVLYQNDWSFELSDFDQMLARAFDGADRRELPPEIDQLEVSQPIAELTQLKNGIPVVTAEGVVKNVGTETRRFIYLRASIKRNRRVVAAEEAPAGNLFKRSELSELTERRLHAALNPAGRQGRNARVEPGESVAYMVVIGGLPEGFELSKHRVVAEVSQAELTDSDE